MTKAVVLSTLESYQDDRGNVIVCRKILDKHIRIEFRGSNNRLVISDGALITWLTVCFDGSGATCKIGSNSFGANAEDRGIRPHSFKGMMRLGNDSKITIGKDATCTGHVYITAAEGSKVTIGDDCMFAVGNEIRADDSHAIYDVRTKKRLNPSRDIKIGNHVWFAQNASVLAGSRIDSGSVLGLGAILKGRIANNCVAAGVPARVIRKHIAWERPLLTFGLPADVEARNPDYWAVTKPGKKKWLAPLRWILRRFSKK